MEEKITMYIAFWGSLIMSTTISNDILSWVTSLLSVFCLGRYIYLGSKQLIK